MPELLAIKQNQHQLKTAIMLAVKLPPSEHTASTTIGWMQQWSALGQFAGPLLVAWPAAQMGGWHLT